MLDSLLNSMTFLFRKILGSVEAVYELCLIGEGYYISDFEVCVVYQQFVQKFIRKGRE